jgi:DNA invertase Pin-like site-specific DNA recombinase
MEINKKYGYARVSSKSQESNSSIKSQKKQLIQNGVEAENI